MFRWLKQKVNLSFIVNPFYIYCLAFALSIIVYLWGWSIIFPELSAALIIFFTLSFIAYLTVGYKFRLKLEKPIRISPNNKLLNDLMFFIIIILGLLDIIIVGYLPVLNRTQNYREFGVPVIDPLFNTLCIFFSVYFLQTFLISKRKRLLVYFSLIVIFQMLLFRRSTIVWIITSSIFLLIYHYKCVSLKLIIAFIVSLPLLSYGFGLYGNFRSSLSKSFIINDLGASNVFKKSGISHNHYITYLYFCSPLANLQKNIDENNGFLGKGDIKGVVFNSILPESFTNRLKNKEQLITPKCSLVHPELIVGTFLMLSVFDMGWAGMIIMLLYLFTLISLCLLLADKLNTFFITTICLLSTTVSLLIFSNFLNRLDIVLLLFVYPLLFHYLLSFTDKENKQSMAK